MDSFELNKVIGGLLGTVFVVFSVGLVSDALFASPSPEKPGFAIEAAEEPAGGGAGMVLRADVVKGALDSVRDPAAPGTRTILVDARGKPFSQADARRFAREAHLCIVCGRYEGVDARAEAYVDEIVSLGDFVLTGGELAALSIVAAHVR